MSFYESPDFLDGYWDVPLFVSNFIGIDLFSLLFNLFMDLSILLFSSKNQFFISLILCPICYFYVIAFSPSLINLCSLFPLTALFLTSQVCCWVVDMRYLYIFFKCRPLVLWTCLLDPPSLCPVGLVCYIFIFIHF